MHASTLIWQLRRLVLTRPVGGRYRFKWYGGDLALMRAPSGFGEFAHAHHAVPVVSHIAIPSLSVKPDWVEPAKPP